MTLTIDVFKKGDEFIAKCKELEIFSYGSTAEEATKRIAKCVKFYVESASEMSGEEPVFHDYFNDPEANTLN